jgi:hypothetical protein
MPRCLSINVMLAELRLTQEKTWFREATDLWFGGAA